MVEDRMLAPRTPGAFPSAPISMQSPASFFGNSMMELAAMPSLASSSSAAAVSPRPDRSMPPPNSVSSRRATPSNSNKGTPEWRGDDLQKLRNMASGASVTSVEGDEDDDDDEDEDEEEEEEEEDEGEEGDEGEPMPEGVNTGGPMSSPVDEEAGSEGEAEDVPEVMTYLDDPNFLQSLLQPTPMDDGSGLTPGGTHAAPTPGAQAIDKAIAVISNVMGALTSTAASEEAQAENEVQSRKRTRRTTAGHSSDPNQTQEAIPAYLQPIVLEQMKVVANLTGQPMSASGDIRWQDAVNVLNTLLDLCGKRGQTTGSALGNRASVTSSSAAPWQASMPGPLGCVQWSSNQGMGPSLAGTSSNATQFQEHTAFDPTFSFLDVPYGDEDDPMDPDWSAAVHEYVSKNIPSTSAARSTSLSRPLTPSQLQNQATPFPISHDATAQSQKDHYALEARTMYTPASGHSATPRSNHAPAPQEGNPAAGMSTAAQNTHSLPRDLQRVVDGSANMNMLGCMQPDRSDQAGRENGATETAASVLNIATDFTQRPKAGLRPRVVERSASPETSRKGKARETTSESQDFPVLMDEEELTIALRAREAERKRLGRERARARLQAEAPESQVQVRGRPALSPEIKQARKRERNRLQAQRRREKAQEDERRLLRIARGEVDMPNLGTRDDVAELRAENRMLRAEMERLREENARLRADLVANQAPPTRFAESARSRWTDYERSRVPARRAPPQHDWQRDVRSRSGYAYNDAYDRRDAREDSYYAPGAYDDEADDGRSFYDEEDEDEEQEEEDEEGEEEEEGEGGERGERYLHGDASSLVARAHHADQLFLDDRSRLRPPRPSNGYRAKVTAGELRSAGRQVGSSRRAPPAKRLRRAA
ncbi:hypothetical protein IE81DRAFT_366020 [Ceraceosorus guamensis]|uniref:BZIP domain-containing protein n=1 Tax=Ceraceosorus guamensis TaxID=1522189 RepID=A0A316W0J8_9BASI|nr:hypothetical protein IE81DRAFT_366020 [Ceraceosorus guamensis]PWN43219.1 hypothetical protein IE81DRAFT_366020 [Ceraceosorus guamensis]